MNMQDNHVIEAKSIFFPERKNRGQLFLVLRVKLHETNERVSFGKLSIFLSILLNLLS